MVLFILFSPFVSWKTAGEIKTSEMEGKQFVPGRAREAGQDARGALRALECFKAQQDKAE